MRAREEDAGARWLRLVEGLDEPRRRLALAATDPGASRSLAARIHAEGGAAERAAAMVSAEPDPRRWRRAHRATRDALEYLETLGGWVLAPGDATWPSSLDCGSEPVALLVGRGEVPAGQALAVVGTRASSREGEDLAAALAAAWVARGGWVVSGGALGIDGAAHRGALAAGGRTVVVAGTGLGHPFPQQHRGLFASVERRGALVSEHAPTFAGRPWSFLDRNRIIAGFATAVVVVEAPPRSGALSTARFALKCGRKVLTVPGQPGCLRSEGARRLLSEGALPLRGPEDLPAWNQALERQVGEVSPRSSPVGAVGQKVLAVLDTGGEGRHLDDIGRRAALDPGNLSAALLELELGGLVEALSGGRFRRNPGQW
ncbi:MAG: DNA-processing protein DprA [Pseudomonadota bacterium]